jgi:DNA-binding winged helix-turn-helix (wHTH) protein
MLEDGLENSCRIFEFLCRRLEATEILASVDSLNNHCGPLGEDRCPISEPTRTASMIIGFGEFTIDNNGFELKKSGEPVAIEPQVFELLLMLINNRDRVVSRDEILEHVWKGRIVSEATLASRIKAARQAIDDDGTAQRWIRTSHGRGFRFVGYINMTGEAPPRPMQISRVVRREKSAVEAIHKRISTGHAT